MAVTVAILKERFAGETRVAASPETVKKLIGLGLEIVVEAGAGLTAAVPDADYEAAGAKIAKTAKDALKSADVVLKVRRPDDAEIAALWRATASHTLENGPTGNPTRDAKTVEKPIRKAVVKMFKQFPHPK